MAQLLTASHWRSASHAGRGLHGCSNSGTAWASLQVGQSPASQRQSRLSLLAQAEVQGHRCDTLGTATGVTRSAWPQASGSQGHVCSMGTHAVSAMGWLPLMLSLTDAHSWPVPLSQAGCALHGRCPGPAHRCPAAACARPCHLQQTGRPRAAKRARLGAPGCGPAWGHAADGTEPAGQGSGQCKASCVAQHRACCR